MNVTVIGTGYVGTVTGVCLAYLGHQVVCVDADTTKIVQLRRGDLPIYEPHLVEFLELAAQKGSITFTSDIDDAVQGSDIVFIAVGTPSLPSGEANLVYLETAARSIGAAMSPGRYRVVVNKSTVPVGSGNLVEMLVREGIEHGPWAENAGSVLFSIASNPEFLREGNAIADSLYPDRIVIGAECRRPFEALHELYRPLVHQTFESPSFAPRPEGHSAVPIVETSLTSAESIKYAANAFLALKIGFANEIANVCERVGADVVHVMHGIGLDSRIGPKFLNAGIGWGGSCFGKDVKSLLHTASEYGYRARILEATLEVNQAQRLTVIQKLQDKLFILKGRTITLLGLAFKPGTDDLRDAPSLHIIDKLLTMGARINCFDPIAMDACRRQYPDLKIYYFDSPLAAARNADAVVLVTEWDEFKSLDLQALANVMARRILIDGRNLFSPDAALLAGFDYTGIGRSSSKNTDTDAQKITLAAAAASVSG